MSPPQQLFPTHWVKQAFKRESRQPHALTVIERERGNRHMIVEKISTHCYLDNDHPCFIRKVSAWPNVEESAIVHIPQAV